MKYVFLSLCLLVMASNHTASAANKISYAGSYEAELVRMIDGDTYKLKIHVWPGLSQIINVRLGGINTPEKWGKRVPECEKIASGEAMAFAANWLAEHDYQLRVSDVMLGKWAGRVVGQISAPNGDSLSLALLNSGMAKSYHGGKREPWCKDPEENDEDEGHDHDVDKKEKSDRFIISRKPAI